MIRKKMTTCLISLFLLASPISFLIGAPFGAPGTETAPTLVVCNSSAINGVIEIGCWGFSQCINGLTVTHKCDEYHEFERNTMTCILIGSGTTDCTKSVTCDGKPSGLYPDLGDHCQTFISCLDGVYMGRQYCAATLVFNQTIQSCDFASNVDQPCGTRPVVVVG